MSENEFDYLEEEKPKKLQFGWVFPILFKPRQTLKEIAEKNHSVWLAPLLLLMVSALVVVLVSVPVLNQRAAPVEMPPDFEYFSPQQQEQFQQAVNMGSSPVNTIVFPLLLRYAGIWISWFLLGSILHLSLTLNGSRSSNRSALNLVAWASIPFVIRDIVQTVAILTTKQLILKPGLSGFVTDGATGFMIFVGALLGFVDLYLIWQIILLAVGAKQISGLKSGKAWLAVLIAVVVFLSLKALPVFLGAQLSSLSSGGMMF
jgi:hypothetical protein